MTWLTAFMHIVLVSVMIIIPCKLFCDWLDFYEYRREKTTGKLMVLQITVEKWIQRHFSCALLALAINAVITQYPMLQESERLSNATSAYAVICLICTVAESILAGKIACAVQQ